MLNKLPKIVRKIQQLNMLKLLNVNQEDADRITGGLIRLEGKYDKWSQFMNNALALAKTPEERNLMCYLLGIKMGLLADRGLVVMAPFNKKLLEKIGKEKDRPEIR